MNFIKLSRGSDDILINLERVEQIVIVYSDDEEKDEWNKKYIRFQYNDGHNVIPYTDETWNYLLNFIDKAQKGMTIPKPLNVKVVNK